MGRQLGFRGWWADHDYSRRGVEKGVKEFVGWNRISALMKRAREIGEGRRGGSTAERDEAIVAFGFAGGFRVSEFIRWWLPSAVEVPAKDGSTEERTYSGLTPSDVKVVEDADRPHILFDSVMALKGYRKLETLIVDGHKKFRTQRMPLWRTFAIPLDEPIAPVLTAYLKSQARERFLFPITATRAYQVVEAIEPSIWPHWFRAQRASQLAREYRYTLPDLLDFFQWKDQKTAARYASMGPGALLEKIPTRVNRVW